MEQNNITLLINNAVSSNNSNIYNNEQEIIKVFTDVINKNIDLFESANMIDIKNNNGFKLDLNKIKKILNKYSDLSPLINSEDMISITNNDIMKSTLYEKTGILLTLFDGNTYTMLEMILLGILTHNTIIFAYDKYMIGINNLLIDTIQSVIEPMGLNRYMFQHTTNIGSELFNNFKTINKTIIIGDSDFKSKYLSLATTDVLVSGYDNYDIYIESMDHKDVILEIVKNSNINVYVNSEIDYEFDDAIVVDDVDEAITRINYSGANYSSSIFTSDNKSASSFIKDVNSENILVNASPLLVSEFNIDQEQLLRKKNIIMPNIYKFNGEKMEIII